MKNIERLMAASIAALVLSSSAGFAQSGFSNVDSKPETNRDWALRAIYFPFLAVGHGVFAIAEYGIGYPVYYVSKPLIDFAYSSSEDPADFPNSVKPGESESPTH